jgi:hypothetical protein
VLAECVCATLPALAGDAPAEAEAEAEAADAAAEAAQAAAAQAAGADAERLLARALAQVGRHWPV